jgi:hypothetical protein
LTDYIARFSQAINICNNPPMIDQVLWFLQGLSRELQPMCVVDTQGAQWADIHALMQYARGQELVLQARSSHMRGTRTFFPYTRRNEHAHAVFSHEHAHAAFSHEQDGDDSHATGRKRQFEYPQRDTNQRTKYQYGKGSGAVMPIDHYGPPEAVSREWTHLTNHQVVTIFRKGKCFVCYEDLQKAHPKGKSGKRENFPCNPGQPRKPFPPGMELCK